MVSLLFYGDEKKGSHCCNPFIFLRIWLRLLGSNQRPID
ncbi:MAG: hypothetical protein ACJAQ8_000762 [Haliea salexigens]|jgi:hypothetical protein